MTPQGIELSFKMAVEDPGKPGRLAGKSLPINAPVEISHHMMDTQARSYKFSDLKITSDENVG
jgi:hypothetical protein